MMRLSRIRSVCSVLATGASVCLLGGCAPLPDTGGYTAATIQVKQVVSLTGEVVEGEFQTAIRAKATTASDKSLKDLRDAWVATLRSLDAMVIHAQSIEQIVDAGNRGTESAKQVADSVKTLVDAVRMGPLTGATSQMVELSAETAAFVYGEYCRHVSARSLEEALDRFGPSMTKITQLVQAQIGDARRLFVQQIEAQVQLLQSGAQAPEDPDTRFGDWIKYRAGLNSKAEQAAQLLVRGMEKNSPDDIARAKTMMADIEAGEKLVSARLTLYEAKMASVRQREKAGLSILGGADAAVAAWGIAYQQLVKAVKERRPVSMESLTAAVVEVRTLMQRWREL
jgi:hypothetical protein